MKKNILLTLTTLLLAGTLQTYAQDFIPLWQEGKMPNSKGVTLNR